MSLKRDEDRYTKYTITSLEKMQKPQLYLDPDLGIHLDLLDMSVYKPPSVRPPLDPEDEELLRDDELVIPVKKDGIKSKERPTDKGVSWLVKTQYISPLSVEAAKQSLTEKHAKELRELNGGRNILENLNNRERMMQEIEASFEACKLSPVHATNSRLQPVEILPLLPDFDRYDDQFVIAAFDGAPTADSEIYSKLYKSVRDVHESLLSEDMCDEHEDISFSWVREYHWDVRGDDVDDLATYLVLFDEAEARYVPLPTKLVLRKKKATKGRSSDEVERFPIPSRLTVKRRSTVAAVELKESEVYSSSKGSISNSKRGLLDIKSGLGRPHKVVGNQDMNQSCGAKDDMSE